ncbi:MAG: DegT/DnrJ/EryC1/StrS family aminotransferase [Elusimicrobia bacterium]|nr:DegT/DnrJ/EryC1/StrS family aminotransferase [Elusimicrobiota bacterium]
MSKVEFFRHNISEADIRRAAGVLRSVFLTTGAEVASFEESLRKYLGVEHVVGLTSCTAALHLGLQAWGIGEGDEVITPAMSFCATSNAILHAGAVPVFVDSEEATGNIDAALIEDRITRRTKAILPVHLYGHLCDMRALRRLADRRKLVLIEDAAHCLEGRRDGVRVGQLGDAACFSFYATKSITSGEGGAISVHDGRRADLLRHLRLHGIDKGAADRYTKRYRHWDMPVLGWKYNMDNIQAALLVGQMAGVDAGASRRRAIAEEYEKGFAGVPGIAMTRTAPRTEHGRHLFTIRVRASRRDRVLTVLQEEGIGVAVNYRPIHLLSYYRKKFGFKPGAFPVAERIGAETISLPLYPKLKDAEVGTVIRTVRRVVERHG